MYALRIFICHKCGGNGFPSMMLICYISSFLTIVDIMCKKSWTRGQPFRNLQFRIEIDAPFQQTFCSGPYMGHRGLIKASHIGPVLHGPYSIVTSARLWPIYMTGCG